MIVAGIGMRADATEADLHAALTLTRRTPDTLATLAIKVTPALRLFADNLGVLRISRHVPFRRVFRPGSGQDHLPRPPHCASPVAVPN